MYSSGTTPSSDGVGGPPSERPLIVPVRREIWRPFHPAAAMVGAVVVASSVAAIRGSAVAVDVALFVGVVVVAMAAVRTVLWWLLPGRVVVSYDDSGVFVRRGAKVLRHYPWRDVDRIDVVPGYRWPEWTRAAMFSYLSVMWADRRGGADVSPEFLVVARPSVESAQLALHEVASRYLREPRP